MNVKEDRIFYPDFQEDYCIHRQNLNANDEPNGLPINQEDSSYLKVIEDWIYYCNEDDEGNLYRIRTDGTEREKLP